MNRLKKIYLAIISMSMIMNALTAANAENRIMEAETETAVSGSGEASETQAVTDGSYMPLTVSYDQAEARKVFDMVNELRTGDDAWAWNSGNTEKVEYDLEELVYDYELERVAMQRAAEIAVSLSHLRPDGSSCYTAYPPSLQGNWGENIAYWYTDAAGVFDLWKEEDEYYAGQPHRRNMLGAQFKSIGIACVNYNGTRYWVQEFSSRTADSTPVTYTKNNVDVNIPIKASDGQMKIAFSDASLENSPKIYLETGSSIAVPAVTAQFYYRGSLFKNLGTVTDVNSSDTSLVKISNGRLVQAGNGDCEIIYTASFGSYTAVKKLCVEAGEHIHAWTISSWKWAQDYKSATAEFICTKNSEHRESKAASVTSQTAPPSCYQDGATVYTASVTLDGNTYTDSKTVILKATGDHKYQKPVYTWASDNTAVSASALCANGGETIGETVKTSYEIITAPGAASEGKGRFTAVFANPVFEKQTKDITIPATGLMASSLKISIHDATIVYDNTVQLEAETGQDNIYSSTVIWSSTDESIAAVNTKGLVRGAKAGTAIVTAMNLYGAKDTCVVKVLFSDVKDSSRYFFDPVYWALDNNITVGAGGAGKFSPYADCTREQIVTFLWRLMGEPEPKSASSFADVSSAAWYYKPITWAYENGITTGLNDGTNRFGVGQPCTREQCVTFLYRTAKEPEMDSHESFTDVKSDAYYYDAISWAASKGITVGLNDGTGRFGVGQTCIRAMIVTFLYRFAHI